MRNIFIDDSFFEFGKRKAVNLISSLKMFNRNGFINCFNKSVFEKYPGLKVILTSEGIKYKTIKFNKQMIFIGKGFKNLEEAVKSVSKGRRAEVVRKTKETEISVKLNLDGAGESKIATGIGFFDHMLEQIARHSNIQLELFCKGDIHIDEHHTVEDTGIVLGEALRKALGDKKGIQRYGFFIPMDESASICTIDLCGRSYLNFECQFKRDYVGGFPVELVEEFFRAAAAGLKAAVFIKAKGRNDHHKIESIFKAFAKSLNEACRFDERNNNRLPSTKGVL